MDKIKKKVAGFYVFICVIFILDYTLSYVYVMRMIMNPFTVLIVIAIGIGAICEIIQQIPPDLFIPEQGVVCDRIVDFCATKEGVSDYYSLHYLNGTIRPESGVVNPRDEPIANPIDSHSKEAELQFSHGIICSLKNKNCRPASKRASYIESNLFY
ncbi:YcgJ family protein [Plesiomonas sp.]|uniref:YcgJ family protein n=1 Tax=Plesiomonas sp. TaxID=2486279 RepID=UPI003F3E8DCD